MTRDAGARVGVVVAARDAAAFLGAALDSLRAQTVGSWCCVVVDDGSTDDTAAVARAHAAADPRIRVVEGPPRGVSAARNAGLAALPGPPDTVAFLDADDLWLPTALADLLAALDADPAAVGAYGVAEYVDVDGRPVRPGAHPAAQRDRRRMGRLDLVAVPPGEPATFSALVVVGPVWPAAVGLHRRAVVDAVGGFAPELAVAEDWDLYLRMSRHGHFRPVDTQVAWYRRHPGNATAGRRDAQVARGVDTVRWRAWSSPDNTPAQRREAGRVFRRLTGRQVAWGLAHAARAVAAGRGSDAALGVRAAAVAGARLVRAHPRPPSDRPGDDVVGAFLQRRAAGAGQADGPAGD